MPDQNDDVLDATIPDPNEAAPGLDAPQSKPYDPEHHRFGLRGHGILFWGAIGQ